MKKIPTIFERDWNGDRSRVVSEINPTAQWVFDGEGVATVKLDGTSCLVRDGALFKRRELTRAQIEDNLAPAGFEIEDYDPVTDKVVGWVPVGDGPEDRWHREAFALKQEWANGTYELVGPKVQGNPERMSEHELIRHSDPSLVIGEFFERTFVGIRAYLEACSIEGIVFHHPDGRMAKIKGKDFGFKRAK